MAMGIYNDFSPRERAPLGAWRRAELLAGRLEPYRVCSICGASGGIVDAHREDYSPPYSAEDDIPACYRCHMMIHTRHKYPEAWDAYRAEIRRGCHWPAMRRRDFPRFLQETVFRMRTVRLVRREEPPELCVLDLIHEGKLCPAGRRTTRAVGKARQDRRSAHDSRARIPNYRADRATSHPQPG